MTNHYAHPEYDRFKELTSTMSIINSYPEDAVTWFVNKGAVANKNHPNFKEAFELAKKIMRKTRWDS